MLNFDKLINLCIVEINKINININKNRYISKYSNYYYLSMIFYVLNDINSWSVLHKLKEHTSNKKFHYKTIYNKFRFWSNKNIFKNAFYNYFYKNNTNLLLIDATSINNKYGSECLGINPEYKKKKVTKLSIITSSNGFIYSIIPFNIKNKFKNYNTFVHDSKMINDSLTNIKNIKNNSKYFILLADKAYMSKNKYKLTNKFVKIITPNKINSKNKNTKSENKKLKKRIIVENTINNIKLYNRVNIRKEKKIKYYMSWIYISCLINNLKY